MQLARAVAKEENEEEEEVTGIQLDRSDRVKRHCDIN